MRYMLATVIVGVPDEEMKDWSEHSDVTRFLQFRGLHQPGVMLYLHRHDEYPKITEKQFKKMHQCIDEHGGT